MPGALQNEDKGKKQKKLNLIKRDGVKKATSLEEEVAGNESGERKKAAGRDVTKDRKKQEAAKTSPKAAAAPKVEEFKVRSRWGQRASWDSTAKGMTVFLKKYPHALLPSDLASLTPAEARRCMLFVEPKDALGITSALFPKGSLDTSNCAPDPRQWGLPLEPEVEQQKRLIGVLKASEARNRIRALRLRYIRMRTEEIKHLISRQKTARAAIRLEIFLPPHLNPTKIRDCLDRRERHRVEAILEEDNVNPLFK